MNVDWVSLIGTNLTYFEVWFHSSEAAGPDRSVEGDITYESAK